MSKEIRAVVFVSGGRVEDVISNATRFKYRIVDYDSIKAGQESPEDTKPDADKERLKALRWLVTGKND